MIGYADIGIEIDISKIVNPLVIRILNVSHIYFIPFREVLT